MFPVRYELGFYIPEEDILHSLRRENLKSYIEVANSSNNDTSTELQVTFKYILTVILIFTQFKSNILLHLDVWNSQRQS
jgi:hypothetical protein